MNVFLIEPPNPQALASPVPFLFGCLAVPGERHALWLAGPGSLISKFVPAPTWGYHPRPPKRPKIRHPRIWGPKRPSKHKDLTFCSQGPRQGGGYQKSWFVGSLCLCGFLWGPLKTWHVLVVLGMLGHCYGHFGGPGWSRLLCSSCLGSIL